MEPIELRDLDAARRYILEGLWLQRALKTTAKTVKPVVVAARPAAAGEAVSALQILLDGVEANVRRK